jgi:hypothetical protein
MPAGELMNKIAVFLLLLLLNNTQILAQEQEPEKWYWAWNRVTSELYAYSSNGDSNLLLAEVSNWSDDIWRIGDNQAMALLNVSDQLQMYLLDNIAAIPLSAQFDIEALIVAGSGLRFEAYHFPYMILTTWIPLNKEPYKPALLVNLSTRHIKILSNSVSLGTCCVITNDGTAIRYASIEGDYGAETLHIYELSLDTQIEQMLSLVSGLSFVVQTDSRGERWLIQEQNIDSSFLTYHVLHTANGTSELIYERDPSEYYVSYYFDRDDLVSYQPLCGTDCTVALQTIDGHTFSYPLPDTPGGASISSYYHTSDHKLIVGRLYDYWILTPDAVPRFMDYRYSGGSHLPSTTSPNGRFSLIAKTQDYPQEQRMVIDWETQEIVVTLDANLEDSVYMTYVREGFFVNSLNYGRRVMYHYADQTALELPDIGYGHYFDMLSDGSVLYSTTTGASADQIFRYFPQNNATILLIDDMLNLPTRDVENYTNSQFWS